MAGILFVGFLPFCLSQEFNFQTYIINNLKESGLSKGDTAFLLALDSISAAKASYFDENCSQKAELYRNYGAYYYYRGKSDSVQMYFIDSAYNHIRSCSEPDKAIELQILTNIESFSFNYKKHSIYENVITKLVDYIKTNKGQDSEAYLAIEANSKYRIGLYFRNLKDYDQALIYLNESIATYNKIDLKSNKPLRTMRELGRVHRLIENFDEAIRINNKGLKLSKELGITSFEYTTEFKIENIYAFIGQEKYSEAYKLLDIVEKELKEKNQTKQLFLVPLNKAIIENKKGNIRKAIDFFIEAERTIKVNGAGVNDRNLFYLYGQIASLELKLNNIQKAESYIKKALLVSAYPVKFLEYSMVLNNSTIFEPQDFLTTANTYLDVLIEKNAPPEKLISVVDKMDSIYYLVQPTLSGQHAQNALAGSYHKMAEILTNYLFENNLQNEFPKALAYYISSSKSKSLLSNAIFQDNVDLDIQNKFKELNIEKARIESELLSANITEKYTVFDSLAAINFSLNSEIQEIYNSTNKKQLGKFYKEFRYTLLQNIMDSQKDEYLIDGIISDSTFYCYVVGNNTYSFHKLHIGFLDNLTSKTIFTETDLQNNNQLNKIITRLSSEFEKVLPRDENITSIQFILDGLLLTIPMELLMYKDSMLIQKYAVSYLNSFRDGNSVSRRNKRNNPYIGFGLLYSDIVLDKIYQAKELEQIYDRNSRLMPLPGAINEINNCNKVISGNTFLNKDCTRQNFLEFSENNKIIHITNHVLLNNDEAGLSSIVFAENDNYDLLFAKEISGLQLNNDLSILSSCNSGAGKDFTGNGLRSLGQTFFEAGSKAVLVNLWEAGDKSSNKIITSFIQYIKDGKKKSQALRQAKTDFLAQATPAQKHPKYWANLILIGNDDPIVFREIPMNYNWLYILIGLFFSGLVIFFILKKK